MAIEAIEIPEGWHLTKEPILVKVRTDQYVTTPGVRWRQRHNLFDPTDGCSTVIGGAWWNANVGEDLTFNWVASGADGISSLQTNELGLPKGVWLDLYVLPVLNNHPQLSKHFRVYRSASFSSTILFEALEANSAILLEITNNGFSTNVLTTPGQTLSVNSNMKLRLKVGASTLWLGREWVETDWQMYDVRIADDLDTGELYVDVSDAVRSLMTMPKIDVTNYVNNVAGMTSRTVYVAVAEHDESAENPWEAHAKVFPAFFVLQGGRKRQDWPLAYIEQFTQAARRVISNLPKKRFACEGHSTVLHFHRPVNGETVKVRKWLTMASTAEPDVLLLDVDAGMENDLLKLSIDAHLTGEYRRVDVFSGEYNEANVWASYELLPPTNFGFTLYYLNAYGVLESLWCESERVVQVDHTRQEVLTRDSAKDGAQQFVSRSYGRSLLPTVKASTRMVYGANWAKTLDLLLSPMLWYVLTDAGKLVVIPCSLDPGSVTDGSVNYTGDYASMVNFTLRMNQEEGWSDEAGIGL